MINPAVKGSGRSGLYPRQHKEEIRLPKGESMRTICFGLLLLAPAVGVAADISVGGVSLAIPSPNGFSPVTPRMASLYELQKQFVPPTNEEFASFIPERDVPAVLKDNIPAMPRRFTVQTAKRLIGASVSTADFAQMKNIIKSQNDELKKKVEAQLPGLMKQMNDGITKKYDIDRAFSISQVVPMPAHEETGRTFAFSALVKYDMKNDHGIPRSFVGVFTTTLVHVKSKVLFLYSYAEKSGLEWSRGASRQWANAVVAGNPSDLRTSVKEALPAAVLGIDWWRIGDKAAGGAISGAIIGLILWAMKRGKAS
jgi:hypothetical protein